MNKSYWLSLFLPCLLVIGWGINIPSGHHGVKYYKFEGVTQMDKIYGEGFQWQFPWNSFFVYKTQLNEPKENLHFLLGEGAYIELETSVWFRTVTNKLDSLQITVGPDYYNVVIGPALGGEARSIVGSYNLDEICSTKRERIAFEILQSMKNILQGKHVVVENVIIRNVTLPKKITDAIENEPTTDQEQMRMQFVLMKERQEAERKRIEAERIRDFQVL